MKNILYLIICLTCNFQITLAQSIEGDDQSNRLIIHVIDATNEIALNDYSIKISNHFDTVHIKVDSAKLLRYNLDSVGYHIINISKDGYKDLRIEWHQPIEPADIDITIRLVNKDLAKKKKNQTLKTSRKWFKSNSNQDIGRLGRKLINKEIITAKVTLKSFGKTKTTYWFENKSY